MVERSVAKCIFERRMKFTYLLKSISLIIIIVSIIGCSQNRFENTSNDYLDDEERNNIEAYYLAEDVVTYAYLNSDLNVDLAKCEETTFYDNNKYIINKSEFLNAYDWFVYIPRYVCEDCIVDLCGIFQNQDLMEDVAFILPYDEDFNNLVKAVGLSSSNIKYIKGKMGIPAENENLMFVFTISPNYKVKNVYVPDRKLKNLTESYINVINLKKAGQQNIRNTNTN